MAQEAPATPTTAELHAAYPLNQTAEIEVLLHRERIGGIFSGRQQGFVGTLGPCAMTGAIATIQSEGDVMTAATNEVEGLIVVHRLPFWKPRTNPENWHGLETTDPEQAYKTIVNQANRGDALAVEVAKDYHIQRYGGAITMAWLGGRNVTSGKSLMLDLAMEHPDLPIAIKNGLDGEVGPALEIVKEINDLRGQENAPAILLYRGGENAKAPDAWEYQYRKALELTDGKMQVDTAHGTEMAHHPDGNFKKSIPGQIAALDHVIAIAEDHGEIPAGLMAEASRADSPTDPHMPLRIALDGVKQLNKLKMRQQQIPVSV